MLDRLLYRGAPLRLGGRFRTVDGARMYERYAITDRGPVVVLVHGAGVSSRYFLPTAGRLAATCSVYAPDLPGFGRSSRLRGRPTVRRLADALEAWLDAAGLGAPEAVVANSFGCQIVVDLAARRPARMARLVLSAPTIDAHARSLHRQGSRLAVDIVHEPLALWAIQAVDYTRHLAKSGFAAFVEMVRDRVEEKLPRVLAPTLVVRGSRDPIVPRAWAQEVAALLPNGRFAEIEGAPHAVNYTAGDALARLTLEHLRSPVPPG